MRSDDSNEGSEIRPDTEFKRIVTDDLEDLQNKVRQDNLKAFFEIELRKGRNPLDILDSVTRKK